MPITVGLLVFPQVQQLDLTRPYEVFASVVDVRVELVGRTLGGVTSATGLLLSPTIDFATCPQLGVLCIPGGTGVNALLTEPDTLAFIRRQAVREPGM